MHKFTPLSILFSIIAVYLLNPLSLTPTNLIAKLGEKIFLKSLNDTEYRTLTFTKKSETFTIVNKYTYGKPRIQIDFCECACTSHEATKEIYEQSEENGSSFSIEKSIKLKKCENNNGFAVCNVKFTANKNEIYNVIETKHFEVFYHFIYNSETIKNYLIKVPSSVPQFIIRNVKLIRVADFSKNPSSKTHFFVRENSDQKTIHTTQNLNRKNKYNLQLPGWFQLNNPDNLTMVDEVYSNIFFSNDICKDKSKWTINAKAYTRDDYPIIHNGIQDWKEINKQYLDIKNTSVEKLNENATIDITIFTTDFCKNDCISFNALIVEYKDKIQYLKISDLDKSLEKLNVTMGYGTNLVTRFDYVDIEKNFICINLTTSYVEAQWVCISSMRETDTTCRLVNITQSLDGAAEKCSNIQFTFTPNMELTTGSESTAHTTEVLTSLPTSSVTICTTEDTNSKMWISISYFITIIVLAVFGFLCFIIIKFKFSCKCREAIFRKRQLYIPYNQTLRNNEDDPNATAKRRNFSTPMRRNFSTPSTFTTFSLDDEKE